MQELIFFIGRLHVLALHLPIGMVLLTVLVHWLSRQSRFHSYRQILPLLWACTAMSAVLTVGLGLMHFSEGGFDGPSASAHRLWGIMFTLLTLVAWLLSVFSQRGYRLWGSPLTLLLLIAVSMTGHYGGNLTHGSTYLVEYAPQTLRSLAGLPPRRAQVSSLTDADPYHDVIAPLLDRRCGTCHNSDKQRGQLNLATIDSMLAGGESGPAVVAGNAAESELYRRITLPESHEDFMPAEGKTPLSNEQVRLLGWWINAALPVDTSIAAVAMDADIAGIVAVELGLVASPVITSISYPALAAELKSQLVNQGWLVRELNQDSHGLVVSINSTGQAVTHQMLEVLALANTSIVELNLAGARINDAMLAVLAEMPVLEKLNLANNGISDAGLSILSGYSALRSLNLYGNAAVTNEAVVTLSMLQELNNLYIWGTSIDEAGVAALAAELPALRVTGRSLPAETATQSTPE